MARPTPPPRELTYVPLARIGEDTTFRLRHPGDVSSLARSIAQAGQLFPIEVRQVGDAYQPITGFRRLAALKILFRDRVLVRVHAELADDAAALVAAADALDNAPLERADLLEMRDRYRAMGWSTPALEELITRALEKADERREDLAAELQGLPKPDRTVVDEDALEEGAAPEPPPVVTRDLEGVPRPTPKPVPMEVAEPPEQPPGAAPLGRPRPSEPLEPEAPRELSAAELAEDAARRLSLLTQDLALLAGHWDAVPPHLRRIVADQIAYYRQLGAWLEPAPGDPQ